MKINTRRGFAPIAAIIIALLAIGGGAYGVKKITDKNNKQKKDKQEQVEREQKEKSTSNQSTTLQVKLGEQNKSGQSGQAVILQTGTSTVRVIVNITGKPSGVAQPAHIHLGACPNPGAVKYPLTNVGNGASQTDIPNMTLEQLLSELPLAVNVHKSADEAKVYTSCGDIIKEEKSGDKKDLNNKDDREKSEIEAKEAVKVNYTSGGFSPKIVTIKKGDTVVFENKTGAAFSVASNDHPTHLIYPEFDQYKTDQRGKGEFRFTFEKVGTWGYHDHLNASVRGTVVVTE